MEKGQRLYEGKAKIVYRTDDPDLYWVEYKDDATAFNNLKRGTISNKGVYNNTIASILFGYLGENGIPTHFVRKVSDREMLVKALAIVPIEVVVRNVAAGSLAKRLGLAEGTPMKQTVLELYYKSDELGDPLINEYHVRAMDLATPDELRQIEELALRINDLLGRFLSAHNLELIDFKLEFGRHHGRILLGDEISPDTCRFWDPVTREKLDKDRFRRDLGNVEEAYAEVLRRISGGAANV
ncbi:MAG: phosphoribosylaminoimidazolesuccinocarboxamide synthase [Chloroflexota bacterium]